MNRRARTWPRTARPFSFIRGQEAEAKKSRAALDAAGNYSAPSNTEITSASHVLCAKGLTKSIYRSRRGLLQLLIENTI